MHERNIIKGSEIMTERFTLKLGRFYGDGQIMQNEEVRDLLNTQHETIQTLTMDKKELQDYLARRDNKVKETLQKHYNTYFDKEHEDLDPMVYASEVIDEITEELGVDLE